MEGTLGTRALSYQATSSNSASVSLGLASVYGLFTRHLNLVVCPHVVCISDILICVSCYNLFIFLYPNISSVRFKIIYVNRCFAGMYVCAPFVGQKRALDTLELEHGCETPMWVLGI